MACGQLPLGGCANPDLGHFGPCTPWPGDGGRKVGDVPQRWVRIGADAAAGTFRQYRDIDPDPVADIVADALEAVLADLRQQVESLPQVWVLDESAPEPIFVKAARMRDVLDLLDTGGSDGD